MPACLRSARLRLPSVCRHVVSTQSLSAVGRSVLLGPAVAMAMLAAVCLPAHAANPITLATSVTLSSGSIEPFGITVDSKGDIFFTDAGLNTVNELVAVNGSVPVGSAFSVVSSKANGNWNQPGGVVMDSAGDLLVTDFVNNAVKEILSVSGAIPASPTVRTLVSSGCSGPVGEALDSQGDLFVTCSGTGIVLEVMAVSGSIPSSPTVKTVATVAGFNYGLALDSSGDVYLGSNSNGNISEVVAVGGSIPASPTVKSVATGLGTITSLSSDSNGDLFVSSGNPVAIKEVVAVGGVIPASPTTLTLSTAGSYPAGVALDSKGNVYWTDALTGTVNEIGSSAPNFGSIAVGTTSTSQTLNFNVTAGTTIGSIGYLTQGASNLDFKALSPDTSGTLCTAKTYSTAATCTLDVTFTPTAAGARLGAVVFYDATTPTPNIIGSTYISGTGVGPILGYGYSGANRSNVNIISLPGIMTFDAQGNLYVTNESHGNIVFYVPTQYAIPAITFTRAGATGIAVDGAGDVFYATDSGLLYESVGGMPTNAKPGTLIAQNGNFSTIEEIAVDGAGNVFVADYGNSLVKEVTAASGYVTVKTLGGSGAFSSPYGIAVDGAGNVFVADYGDIKLLELKAANSYATTTTLSSNIGFNGYGIALDPNDNVYVASYTGGGVNELTAASGYATLNSIYNGGKPVAVAFDNVGNLYFTDNTTGVDEIPFPTTSYSFHDTNIGSTSVDSPVTFTLSNAGNGPATFTIPTTGTNPAFAGTPSSYSLSNSSTCPQLTSTSSTQTLAVGASCTYLVNFTPTTANNVATLTTTDSSSGGAANTQVITFNGAGLVSVVAPTVATVSAVSATFGSTTGLTVTATESGSNGLATGDVVTFGTAGSIGGSFNPTTCTITSSGTCTTTYTPSGTLAVGAYTADITASFAAGTYYTATTASSTLTIVPLTSTAPSVQIPATGATQTATIAFTSTFTLGSVKVLTTGITGLDFNAVTGGTCVSGFSATPGASCTVEYAFTPKYPGLRTGAIDIFDGSNVLQAAVYISGIGLGAEAAIYPGTQTTLLSGFGSDAFGLAIDASSNLYLYQGATITKEAFNGTTYTAAGNIGAGLAGGNGGPDGGGAFGLDGAGNIYAVSGASIVKETLNPVTGVYAQSTIYSGSTGYSTAVDYAGNVYNGATGTLVKLTPGSGSIYTPTTISSAFGIINGIAADSTGNLYICDSGSSTLYKETYSGGNYTRSTIATGLSNCNGVAVDGSGTVYAVADGSSLGVYRYVPNGSSYTALATVGSIGRTNGIVLDGLGNLYITNDSGGNSIVKITVNSNSHTFPTTTGTGTVDSTDGVYNLSVGNIGTQPLVFSIPTTGNNPSIATGFVADADTTCTQLSTASTSAYSLTAGTVCNLGIDFKPTVVGTNSGSVVWTDNTLNVSASTQTASFSGTGIITQVAPTVATVSAVSSVYGTTTGITLTATESGTNGVATGDVVTFGLAGSVGGTLGPTTCAITVAGTCTTTYTPSSSPYLPVGTYTNDITASFAAGTNYLAASATNTVTITAATPTLGTMTFSPAATEPYGTSTIVTISAPLTYTGALPTGAVTFVLNGVTYTATCTGASPATCTYAVPAATIAALSVAPYTVTASLAAAGNYTAATGTSGTFTITATTPVFGTMTFSPAATEPYGTSVIVTVSDPLTYTGALPTGAVKFVLNAVSYTATCTGASPASCTVAVPAATIAALPVAAYTVTASLAALGNYNAATGTSGTFTITATTPTFGTMTFSPASTEPYGTSQIITISDPLTYTGALPTGAVKFVLNAVSYTATCTGTSPATCSYAVPAATVAAIPVNTYTVTASLAALGNYNAATGTSGTFTITAIAPTVSTVSAVSAPYGSVTAVTVTATESGSGGVVTGGVVTFGIGGTATGSFSAPTCTLTAAGTCTTTYIPTGVLTAGTYPAGITASFAAVGNYAAASNTGTLTITTIAPTVATVSSFTSPYGATAGITITATESGTTGGPTTGGIVTFGLAGTATGSFTPTTCVLTAAGTCTTTYVPTGTLAAGPYVNDITASFATVGNYSAATAAATLVILQGAPTITLVSSSNPALLLAPVKLTATVTPPAGTLFAGDTVTFYDNTASAALATVALSGGVASFTTASLAAGTHSITATFNGDADYLLVSSSALSEVVSDFSLVISPTLGSSTSLTVPPGGAATFDFSLGMTNGLLFPAPVALTVSGYPPGSVVSLSPSTLAAGTGTTAVTLNIQTPPPATAMLHDNRFGRGLAPIAFALLLLPFSRRLRKRAGRLGRVVSLGVLLLAGALGMSALTGCGYNTGFFSQYPLSYTVTVTGTSGSLSHSTTVTLTVE